MRRSFLFRGIMLGSVLAAGLALQAPEPAVAGTRRIYPLQFKPVSRGINPLLLAAMAENCTQTFNVIRASQQTTTGGTECRMIAPVRLPAGRTITAFSVASAGVGGDPGSQAALYRTAFLDSEGLPSWEQAAYVSVLGDHPQAWYSDDTLVNTRIKRGAYWVEINSRNNGSLISGVEIRYR